MAAACWQWRIVSACSHYDAELAELLDLRRQRDAQRLYRLRQALLLLPRLIEVPSKLLAFCSSVEPVSG